MSRRLVRSTPSEPGAFLRQVRDRMVGGVGKSFCLLDASQRTLAAMRDEDIPWAPVVVGPREGVGIPLFDACGVPFFDWVNPFNYAGAYATPLWVFELLLVSESSHAYMAPIDWEGVWARADSVEGFPAGLVTLVELKATRRQLASFVLSHFRAP